MSVIFGARPTRRLGPFQSLPKGLRQGYLNPLPPRRFRQARIERGKRCPGVFRARQMPRVGCRELGREIARQAPSELKIGRARGEALAAGAQGVVVQKSAIYLCQVSLPTRKWRDATALTSRLAKSLTTTAALKLEYQALALAVCASATMSERRTEASR